MAYNVSNRYREVIYSGGAVNKAKLTINGIEIPNRQIESIEIYDPLIDNQASTFNLGQFISKQLTIKFKNTDGIPIDGNVELSISTLVDDSYVEVPIGKFLIETNTEDYYTNSKLTCLDYAVKMKTNCDYSELIIGSGSITPVTLENLLKWICNYYGVELGSYPSTNKDYAISTYDNTLSGKYYISQIAELMGSNAHFGRDGKLYLIPIKQSSTVSINALKSKSFKQTYSYKISSVVYNDGVRFAQYGNEDNDTLYIRSDNFFVLDNYENLISNIYNAVKDTTICSLKIENNADPSLDCYDLITYTLGDEEYVTFYSNKTLYQQTLMNTVEISIPTSNQTNTTNVTNVSPQSKVRKIQSEVDQLNGTLKIVSEQTDENTSKIGSLTVANDNLTVQVSNVEKGLQTTNTNLETTNNNVTNLQTQINGVSADFEDFKDNEYVQSINNLQSQIDGAIQFWNGADIPTLNNYPAINWKTEADRVNHQADIYTVIKDVEGELKQGKAYRFDKVDGVWQWIELTDNELSAVQALAQEALNKANTNTSDITVLKQTDTEIKADINGINLKYDTLNNDYQANLTTRKSVSGNPVYIPDSGGYPLEEDIIRGKTIQEAILPSGFSQVEYLQSNANQYIDTGFKPNQDTKIDITFESIQPTNEYYNAPFGVRDNGNAKQMFIGLQSNSESTWFFRYEAQAVITSLGNKYGYNHLVIDKNVYTLNGESYTFTYKEFQSDYSMYLFGYNYNGTQDRLFTGKIIRCKIYDNGAIVRDYIPCRRDSDSVLGLYDLVNNTFNENKTTTPFTAGSVVTTPTMDFPREIINNRGIENLFSYGNSNISGTKNGITYSYDKDTQIWTLSGTATAQTNIGFTPDQILVLPSDIYRQTQFYLGGSISNGKVRTFSQDSNNGWKGIDISLGSNQSYSSLINYPMKLTLTDSLIVRIDSGTILSNFKFRTQITRGRNEYPFVPHGSNYLSQTIYRKNFLNCNISTYTINGLTVTNNKDGTFTLNGTTTANSYVELYDKSEFITLPPGNYIGSLGASVPFYIRINDGDYKVVSSSANIPQQLNLTESFSFNRIYMYISANKTFTNVIIKPMLEKGTVVTDIDTYKRNQVLFDLQGNQLCEMDDLQDSVDETTGGFDKYYNEVVLTGDETFNVDSGAGAYTRYVYYIADSLTATVRNKVISTHFSFLASGHKFYGIFNYNKHIYFYPDTAKITSLAEWKAWLKEQYEAGAPVKIVYKLQNPQTIQLDPVEVELFEGVNNVYTESNVDLDDVDIVYLTDSVLNSQYATRSEVKLAEDRIQTEVSSKTTILETGLAVANNKIDTTNVNLQNQITATNESLGNYATNASVVSIQNTVSTINTSLQSQILITKDIQENGVSKVKTATGFTFDENGLTIDKTGAVTKTNIDEDGMVVYSTSGAETEMLKADSTGVVAENLTSRKYFVCGSKSRFEDYSDGTGCFYIG